MIVYPAIDIKDGKCVRLLQGDFNAVTTYSEDPVDMAKRWQNDGAEWLHVVDLDGAKLGAAQTPNREVVRQIVQQTGLPVQFGGGVRTIESVEAMLEIGVARVVMGTAVARDSQLAQSVFAQFGEKVAVGVDARNGQVAVQGWQEHTGEGAVQLVQRLARIGAQRFIFTDIGRDGMLHGVNIHALAEIASAVPKVPVIASGGVAELQCIDRLMALQTTAPNVDGVIIGKALYAGTVTLPDVLAHIQSQMLS